MRSTSDKAQFLAARKLLSLLGAVGPLLFREMQIP